MTDDDDDRMERAKRIRRMREGRRTGSADRDGDGGGDPSDGDAGSNGSGAGSNDDGARSNGDDADSVDGTDSPNPSETPVTDGESSDDRAGDETAAENRSPTGGSGGDEPDESEWFEESPGATGPDSSSEESATPESSRDDTPGSEPEDDAAAAVSSAAAAAAAFEDGDSESDRGGSSSADDEDDSQAVDDATSETDQPTEIEGPAATRSAETERTDEEIRVLEFRLGDEQYCLNIQHVEEIVREETVTRVPNTPEHVRGVVDLRGQITTILDPKVSLGIDETDDEQLIVVFDEGTFDEQGHVGWVVDEVRQVMPVTESEVKDSPLDHQSVNGVVERDGEFVIWAEPEVALPDDETV
ncbi:chemotaxis protein CheW [Halapricum desulfuricans]|uniref:Chemotaxis signal transduction protein n=1 Tax=Halapricum desulfuricans TaxID=2841257 RepID=A0A897N207_9EURY|nr:chemotaxis protein CheW [Halapricum desulfuricans]QSG06248.1 Chemotaxis signal transduction protein [Halapricum desulfuricans]